MGLSDRDYGRAGAGGGGGWWRRFVGDGGNFFSWALPLFTVAGIRVRLHLLFILFVAAELIWSAVRTDTLGLGYTAISMTVLFVLVLLHEFGHCIACRRMGGEADDILMWPLGGLASCNPPPTWQAHFVTAAGGPLVNVLLIPVTGALVALTSGTQHLVFNPLDPGAELKQMVGYGQVLAWWTYYINIVLLAFNVLLPMFPMDGGRLVQTLLWPRIGFGRSMHLAVRLGLGLAVAVMLFSVVGGNTLLMGIALFCGLTCWQEKQRLAFLEEPGFGGGLGTGAYSGGEAPSLRRKIDAAARRRERERREAEKHAEEVERILAKIKAQGMGSLTSREKKTLAEDTRRRQRTG